MLEQDAREKFLIWFKDQYFYTDNKQVMEVMFWRWVINKKVYIIN